MSTSSTIFEIPGPVEARRIRLWSTVAAVLVLALVLVQVLRLTSSGVFVLEDWAVLLRLDVLAALARGVGSTLLVAVTSVVLALGIGLLLCLARTSRRRGVAAVARVWIETLRGLPELLLVFFIYLGVPAATGYSISTFWALVLGIVLYESTAIAEVFRSGFQSLPRGQTEAAASLGLRTFKTLRFVQLPQVVRQVLPSLVSEMVRVTKASSLGFVIGYTDLLLTGELAIEYLGGEYAVPLFAAMAALYVAICLALSTVARRLSARRS